MTDRRSPEVDLYFDYEDPAEALGLWMAELDGDDPAAPAFDDWMLLLAATRGVRVDGLADLVPRTLLGKSARQHIRGVITDTELAAQVTADRSAWNQVLSGVAAHPAATAWMGHLLRAALTGNGVLLHTPLMHHYLSAVDSPCLEQAVWRHRDGHTGMHDSLLVLDAGAATRERLEELGWSGQSFVSTVTVPVDPWSDSSLSDLRWIGWFGNSLRAEMVLDAALQARFHDGRPLVARMQSWLNYLIIEPTLVRASVIQGVDLLTGHALRLERSTTSDSGWMVRADLGSSWN